MIDVAIFNSYALQKNITEKMQHFTEFRIQLAEMMIKSVVLFDYPRRGRLQQGPSPLRIQGSSLGLLCSVHSPNPTKTIPCPGCVVCKAKKKKSETIYECSKCLVALHVPDCFRFITPQKTYKKAFQRPTQHHSTTEVCIEVNKN
jgi:hypothetical protein